jgi:hypothetical protein
MTAQRDVQREDTDDIPETARYMAEQICLGFKHHDNREREKALEAFTNVDTLQFKHLDADEAREASRGYVEALWEKDAVEDSCRVAGEIDMAALDKADWSGVEAGFQRRASAIGIDSDFAELKTVAWRRHKVGGDYGTPMKQAQTLELRAALQDPNYPEKPRYGESGYGPEAVRYELGVELHDKRRWEEACEVMVPYFERILRAQRENLREDSESTDVADTATW